MLENAKKLSTKQKSQTLTVHASSDENTAAAKVNSDLAQVFSLPDIAGESKKPNMKTGVVPIHDLFDEDISKFNSPEKEEKLVSVIEESDEYNVTPSRP